MTDTPDEPATAAPKKMPGAPLMRQAMSRAVRNNNPGNIEKGAKWIGLADPADPIAAAEKRFCVFTHPKYGFRAMATTILTYARKRHAKDGSAIDTVGDVIARWSPPSENDTQAYARAVAAAIGVSITTKVDLETYQVLAPMIREMARVESGTTAWKQEDIDEGLRLCGVARPSASPAKTRQALALATGTVVAIGGAVGAILEELPPELRDPAEGLWVAITGHAAPPTLIIASVSLAYALWRWWKDHKRATA